MALESFPCVSLSLNVPGFPKSNPTVSTFFKLILSELNVHLKAHLIDVHNEMAFIRNDAAGDFFIVPVSSEEFSLTELKQICEAFEEKHLLGRFIDVDLNDKQGNTISSGKSKPCFFCNEKPAIECRRNNTHDPEQLRLFMFSIMNDYCRQQREDFIVKHLSFLATQAVLTEISLSPKPGLVDKFSNGSHTDMSYQTFVGSTAAISPWFGELVRAGFCFDESNLTNALPVIRNIGLRMETAMFHATRNVNTQKGIIFLMSLSLFACGKIFSQNNRFSVDQFRIIIKEICKDLVNGELDRCADQAKTHGEVIYSKYGFSGARGEAESGFQTIFKFGWPYLTGATALNDKILIKCFLALAANNTDTNILYRSNAEVLTAFQYLCKKALENFNTNNYAEVIDFCKKENISPGGSADLLAVTIFVWSVINSCELQAHAALNQKNDF